MFNIGDKIVYPMHGAGTIDAIEEKDILGEKQNYYIIKMPGEVKVMVPISKADDVGVRGIIDKEEAGKVLQVLEADETVMSHLTMEDLDDCFDHTYHLKAVDGIFERLGLN